MPAQKPHDFFNRFVALGWGGIKEHYGVSGTTVAHWIEEEGRDTLITARSAFVEKLRQRDRAFRHRAVRLGLGDPVADRARRYGVGDNGDHRFERFGA